MRCHKCNKMFRCHFNGSDGCPKCVGSPSKKLDMNYSCVCNNHGNSIKCIMTELEKDPKIIGGYKIVQK